MKSIKNKKKNIKKNKKEYDKLPVQIGNPFIEKHLMEESLEILSLKTTIASQDLGAAVLVSST